MTVERIVPVPYEIQRRAWECAWDICQTMADRYSVYSSVLASRPPESLTWEEVGSLFRLHRELWPRRVS